MSYNPTASEKIRIAQEVFQQRVLSLANEDRRPDPLNFSNGIIIRSPALWLLIFDDRGLGRTDFVTVDNSDAPQTVRFYDNVVRAYSGSETEPYVLRDPHDLEAALKLKVVFRAMGTMYSACNIQPNTASATSEAELRHTVSEVLASLFIILQPLLQEGRRLIRQLNAGLLDRKGASGSRYLAWTTLDPNGFAAADREALKKATTRSEHFLPDETRPRHHGKRRRFEKSDKDGKTDTCTRCGKDFTGHWSEHRRSGQCKK